MQHDLNIGNSNNFGWRQRSKNYENYLNKRRDEIEAITGVQEERDIWLGNADNAFDEDE